MSTDWVNASITTGVDTKRLLESPRTISIQRKPAAKQIQPMGLEGRLEAIGAPIKGKAKKGTKSDRSPRELPGISREERARTHRVTLAKNMATERQASAQASQEAAR
jgi:hypothetical protein